MFEPLQNWGWKNKPNKPLLIAGPCSAESFDQLHTICHALKEHVHCFRAGVWKPRTRPGSFEGLGQIALPWIKEIRKEIDLPFAIEIASAKHVELALAHQINTVWIGARTSVNPFAVQEIAQALAGTGLVVLVKNPINPDLGLWIGAFERLMAVGINKLAAIHRGFSLYEKTPFRNPPLWALAIGLKNHFPELPLICDPSHIGGDRGLIAPIAQKALDLNYDGLMIETHHQPDLAFSDASQQITPERLIQILGELNVRKTTTDDQVFALQLEQLRKQVDLKDQALITIIAERLQIISQIGIEKKNKAVAVFQLERWKEILRTRPVWGKSQGVSSIFIEKLYELIHQESIRIQTAIAEETDE